MASVKASTAGGTVLFVSSTGSSAKPDIDTSLVDKRLCLKASGECTPPEGFTCVSLEDIADGSIDDCLFAGADAELFEAIVPKLATNAVTLLALDGQQFAREVSTPVGRVHYGNLRFAGVTGSSLPLPKL